MDEVPSIWSNLAEAVRRSLRRDLPDRSLARTIAHLLRVSGGSGSSQRPAVRLAALRAAILEMEGRDISLVKLRDHPGIVLEPAAAGTGARRLTCGRPAATNSGATARLVMVKEREGE